MHALNDIYIRYHISCVDGYVMCWIDGMCTEIYILAVATIKKSEALMHTCIFLSWDWDFCYNVSSLHCFRQAHKLCATTQLGTHFPSGSYYSNPHFHNLGLKVGLMLSHSMLLSNTLSRLTDRLRRSERERTQAEMLEGGRDVLIHPIPLSP